MIILVFILALACALSWAMLIRGAAQHQAAGLFALCVTLGAIALGVSAALGLPPETPGHICPPIKEHLSAMNALTWLATYAIPTWLAVWLLNRLGLGCATRGGRLALGLAFLGGAAGAFALFRSNIFLFEMLSTSQGMPQTGSFDSFHRWYWVFTASAALSILSLAALLICGIWSAIRRKRA